MLRGAANRSVKTKVLSRGIASSLKDVIHRGAPIDVHPEVEEALAYNRPVVALETTIVTHGMPYPTNLYTARSVESIVRENGAIPATIGLIKGRVKIGLEPHELEYLADIEKNPSVVKVSRRDIGPVISLKKDGGTTCSTTLIFAALAGIKVFATGGLGGVHRGGENSMDVSADLQELTRCPVGLVSAGVKSILDIGRTLEFLETLGVPVVSYGETDDFPAFYSRQSGFRSPWRVDNPVDAAQILHSQHQLKMSNGVLFGVPIPEQYEAIGQELQRAVETAVHEADENGVSKLGKLVTPWLLKRVGELTKGKSLASNVALIENTAMVGGKIAAEYAKLREAQGHIKPFKHVNLPDSATGNTSTKSSVESPPNPDATTPCKLMVVGSAAVDVTAQALISDPSLASQSTVPGSVSLSLGGVGRNIAEAAHQLLSKSKQYANSTVLVAPIGDDPFGRLLVDEMKHSGLRTDGLIQEKSGRTAVCNMVLDTNGNLVSGVADMDLVHDLDAKSVLDALKKFQPELLAIDGNLSENALKSIASHCVDHNIKLFFEPTSIVKSTRILPAIAATLGRSKPIQSPIAFASPNTLELTSIYQAVTSTDLELTSSDAWWQVIDGLTLGTEFRMSLDILARSNACDQNPEKGTLSFILEYGIAQMAVKLLPFFQHLLIKCGELGIVAVFWVPHDTPSAWHHEHSNIAARQVVNNSQSGGTVVLKHFPAKVLDAGEIVSVTGAGDSFVGSVLSSLVVTPGAFEYPQTLDTLIEKAQTVATATLRSSLAVSPKLSQIE
ncbi:indigoidine synthase A-like protein [Abortiporus biennis]|nr:indigoidine synthase A-like protein [Abortiporus biennis]